MKLSEAHKMLFVVNLILAVAGIELRANQEVVLSQLQPNLQPIYTLAQNNFPAGGGWSHSLKGGNVVLAEENRRVVMGSHLDVTADEVLDEVVVIGGSADIAGTVKRLIVMGGNVRLLATAVVSEELNVVGGVVDKDPGAQVHGKQVKLGVPLSDETWGMIQGKLAQSEIGQFLLGTQFQFGLALLKIIIFLIFSLMGRYVAPHYSAKVERAMREKPIQQLIWGFVSFFIFWPIMILLCITVVGIPLLPLQFSLAFLFIMLGYAYLSKILGEQIANRVNLLKKASPWICTLLGLVVVEMVTEAPLVGGIIHWALLVTGFGAASKTFYAQVIKPEKTAAGP